MLIVKSRFARFDYSQIRDKNVAIELLSSIATKMSLLEFYCDKNVAIELRFSIATKMSLLISHHSYCDKNVAIKNIISF